MNCILVDCRDHGESPHSDFIDYNVMSADLLNVIMKNSLGRVILIGHSMGGKLAMQFAFDSAHLVHKLVVIDIAPVKYSNSDNMEVIRSLKSVPVKDIKRREEADGFLKHSISDPFVRGFLLQNLVQDPSDNSFKWRVNLNTLEKCLGEIMGHTFDDQQFVGETFFIRGTNSPFVQPSYYPLIKQMFPHSEVKEVKGSHYLHSENRAEFLDVLVPFLNKK